MTYKNTCGEGFLNCELGGVACNNEEREGVGVMHKLSLCLSIFCCWVSNLSFKSYNKRYTMLAVWNNFNTQETLGQNDRAKGIIELGCTWVVAGSLLALSIDNLIASSALVSIDICTSPSVEWDKEQYIYNKQ